MKKVLMFPVYCISPMSSCLPGSWNSDDIC